MPEDKPPENSEAADIGEADAVVAPPPEADASESRLPRTVHIAGPRSRSSQEISERASELLKALFEGRMMKFIGYSLALHVALVVVFSLPGWVLPSKPTEKAQGQTPAAKADAPAQPSKEGKPAAAEKAGADTREQGKERVEKALGHHAAKPGEIPKSPSDAGAKDDLLNE